MDKVLYIFRISIHAAREGGDLIELNRHFSEAISIHAAREGGDVNVFHSFPLVTVFQSTPPVKAATACIRSPCGYNRISIHAAREGGDSCDRYAKIISPLFQSTPPVKAATCLFASSLFLISFQSTPPVKAATRFIISSESSPIISIHAAREGGDKSRTILSAVADYFNPRRP